MKRFMLMLACIFVLTTLAACGGVCEHIDEDDNNLCDICFTHFSDGVDITVTHTHTIKR